MALSYQVSCAPGANSTIADQTTVSGGPCVTITNHHATEVLLIGGDENNDTTGQKSKTAAPLTVATGFRLPAGKSITVVLGGSDALFGRGGNSTATCSVSVLRSNSPSAGGIG